jgi:hypothetical protein
MGWIRDDRCNKTPCRRFKRHYQPQIRGAIEQTKKKPVFLAILIGRILSKSLTYILCHYSKALYLLDSEPLLAYNTLTKDRFIFGKNLLLSARPSIYAAYIALITYD